MGLKFEPKKFKFGMRTLKTGIKWMIEATPLAIF